MTEMPGWPKQLRTANDYLQLPGVLKVTSGRNRVVTLLVTPELTDREIRRLEGYIERFREVNCIVTVERISI